MPNFANLLKEAKVGRVQVIHEFLTNFDPFKNRLHCFYEGREDEIFYRTFIASRSNARLIAYFPGNKDEVYGVLAFVAKHAGCQQSLFFVDKDLSDVLGEQRPAHPRLFVTHYYSVENYLVREEVLGRFCRDFIQCRGVVCDHDQSCTDFAEALMTFYNLILPVMAWVIVMRRRGQKPNLRNLKLKTWFTFDSSLQIANKIKGNRISQLGAQTGINPIPGIGRDLRAALVDLRSREPKCVVRGHFESWFFVEYFKGLFERLKAAAEKQDGSASMIPAVEHSSFVALAVPSIAIPPDLAAFLVTNV